MNVYIKVCVCIAHDTFAILYIRTYFEHSSWTAGESIAESNGGDDDENVDDGDNDWGDLIKIFCAAATEQLIFKFSPTVSLSVT